MKCKIYLTKSEEVGRMIFKSLSEEVAKVGQQDYEINAHFGKLYEDSSVPAIYHNKGYWLCGIFYHTQDLNEYSLTIA